jgi:sugar (pentulose or hexulose) kinase
MFMKMLALDLGSSFTKSALLVDGDVQQERKLPAPEPLSKDGDFYEIDAEVYYQQILSLIAAYLNTGDIQGILFSTQMHGYVLTDTSIKPRTPYISWQDQMGTKYLPLLREKLTDADVYPSGVPLKGNLALCSLLARLAEGKVALNGMLFHTLGGYMIARLTGNHICHISNAAPTGLADIQKSCWNQDLLERLGLFSLCMPKIVDEIEPVGSYRGVAVYPDIGDQQVSAYGAELQMEHSLHVNIGTAGLLGALCKEFIVNHCESRPWLEKGCYLRTVTGLPGGRHVQKLRNQYDEIDDKVWPMLTQKPDTKAISCYLKMADIYFNAAKKMAFPIRELCYSGGCVLKNPALRSTLENKFNLLGDKHTKTAEIWSGMIKLVRKIEKERYSG